MGRGLVGISLECSSCPGLAGVLNIDNDPGRYADGGNQTCYNSGSAGHCSLPWSESQGQAPAQSRGFSSAGLSFQGNPHLLTALAFLLPFRLAQVCVCVCVLEVFTSRFYGTDSLTESESQPGGFGEVTPWPCVASQGLTYNGLQPLCLPSDSGYHTWL